MSTVTDVPWQDFQKAFMSSSHSSTQGHSESIAISKCQWWALLCKWSTYTDKPTKSRFIKLFSGGNAADNDHSGKKECIWLGPSWWGPTGDERLHKILHATVVIKADKRLVPNVPRRPSQDRNHQTRQPLAISEVCNWMSKVERIKVLNLVLTFLYHVRFIHTSCLDEQCIT